jgi:hypothetical protein
MGTTYNLTSSSKLAKTLGVIMFSMLALLNKRASEANSMQRLKFITMTTSKSVVACIPKWLCMPVVGDSRAGAADTESNKCC